MSSLTRHAALETKGQAPSGAPQVGVIMLDTQFPRIMGDIGCPDSFIRPPLLAVAKGVQVRDIVRPERASPEAIDALSEAARALEAQGADVLATSCGFLHGLQGHLAAATKIPLVASSLWLTTRIARKGYRIGLLTADAPALAPAIEGIKVPFIVEGLEGSKAFASAILADGHLLDPAQIEADTVAAALRAKTRGATAILLECTNLPPYCAAIERETQLPVFDIFDALEDVAGAKVRA